MPSPEEILPVFKKVEPILCDLEAQIRVISPKSVDGATLLELLGDMPVSEIHGRMNGGTSPLVISPEAKVRAQRTISAGQLAETQSAHGGSVEEPLHTNIASSNREVVRSQPVQSDTPSVENASKSPTPQTQSAPMQGKTGAQQTPPPNPPAPPPPAASPTTDTPHTPPKAPQQTSPKVPPEPLVEPPKGSLPKKIGIGGSVAQLALGGVFEAGLSAANDGKAGDVTKAGLHGLANGVLPGITEGFSNITQNNKHQNWIDQTLNAGTTATQGVAVSALAVAGGATVAAPVTGGTSLAVAAGSMVVAGVSGLANLGIGVVHDVTYVTGASKQGGLITGLVGMASQLADSKAAHRASDWFMGNDAKVQQKLAAIGIKPNQSAVADENKDGILSTQEVRDYLIKHRVAAEHVNSLPAKELADTFAAVLTAEAMVAAKAAGKPSAGAGVITGQALQSAHVVPPAAHPPKQAPQQRH